MPTQPERSDRRGHLDVSMIGIMWGGIHAGRPPFHGGIGGGGAGRLLTEMRELRENSTMWGGIRAWLLGGAPKKWIMSVKTGDFGI